MSKDPIEEGGGLNLYAGLNNAPTCRIDAWGMRNEPPSTVYFLGYKTVGFVYEGYCGEWNWLIKWILSYLADGDGYVIQHIHAERSAFDCSNPPKPIKCSKWRKSLKNPDDFWEVVGTIKEGRRVTRDMGDDEWSDPECDTCTQGRITIEGSASFYDSIRPAPPAPPPGLPNGGCGFLGHMCGYSPPQPDGVRRIVGPAVRKAVVSWNCCKGRAKTEVALTP